MEWLSQNWGTILVALMVILSAAALIFSRVKDKKNGKGCCGGCDGCAMKDKCHTDNKKED